MNCFRLEPRLPQTGNKIITQSYLCCSPSNIPNMKLPIHFFLPISYFPSFHLFFFYFFSLFTLLLFFPFLYFSFLFFSFLFFSFLFFSFLFFSFLFFSFSFLFFFFSFSFLFLFFFFSFLFLFLFFSFLFFLCLFFLHSWQRQLWGFNWTDYHNWNGVYVYPYIISAKVNNINLMYPGSPQYSADTNNNNRTFILYIFFWNFNLSLIYSFT
jgi:hypothetical protein